MVESALVLETAFGAAADPEGAALPWRSRFDLLVVVSAPETDRLERYVRRVLAADPSQTRDAALDDARARFAAQMPEAQKRALADVVLGNDGSLDLLRQRVQQLYARLVLQAEAGADEAM